MKNKWIPALLSACALVLELLPFGAVLIFATPEETFRRTYSYFSLTPYGYANFGPFLTACLTCAIVAMAVCRLVIRRDRILTCVLRETTALAVITSLLPLLFGIRQFSVVGALISLFLLAQWVVLLLTTIQRKPKQ